ncbi:hypothetical protein PsAD37_01958 [Pseudovibrio sp. Ad37]|nr:hypothetical protein PsAD37_01958 [Pseudovibrio sp. Ad37]
MKFSAIAAALAFFTMQPALAQTPVFVGDALWTERLI